MIEAGIYAQIAVPLKGGEYRKVSMALFAQELANGVPGEIVPVDVAEPPEYVDQYPSASSYGALPASSVSTGSGAAANWRAAKRRGLLAACVRERLWASAQESRIVPVAGAPQDLALQGRVRAPVPTPDLAGVGDGGGRGGRQAGLTEV